MLCEGAAKSVTSLKTVKNLRIIYTTLSHTVVETAQAKNNAAKTHVNLFANG
jgi:hypothetical protein